ncbi:MAG TPA: hypothetical protein VE035_07005 [Puia sp.]|nr:hypothetical protein [Puia sp.]
MAKFITRVQLQQAEPVDFEKLDIEMQRESFIRVWRDHAGEKYQSEATEYNFQGNISLLDVNGAVSRAANRTGKAKRWQMLRLNNV